MNCTYYIVFEQNYKQYRWWMDKKKRIQKQIETNDTTQMQVKRENILGTLDFELNGQNIWCSM